MAIFTFNESVGITYNADSTCFDCDDQVILDLAGEAINSAEANGTFFLSQRVFAIDFASSEVFGTPRLNIKVQAVTGIPSGESVGTGGRVSHRVFGQSFADPDAYGTAVLDQRLFGVGIGTTEVFGTLNAGLKVNAPTGIISAEVFNSPQLNQRVLGQGFVDPTILSVNGNIQLQLDIVGIPSEEAVPTQFIGYTYDSPPAGVSFDNDPGYFDGPETWTNITPDGLVSLEAFGTVVIQHGLLPSAIAGVEAFGSPQLNLIVDPVAVAGQEAFGTLVIDQKLFLAAIASQEAFGDFVRGARLYATGIATAEAFGSGQLNHVCKPDQIVEASGNKLLWSHDFTNSSWQLGGVTVNANVILAPDGRMTADELVENTGTNNHQIRTVNFTNNIRGEHICQVEAKLGVGSRLLKFNGFGNGAAGVTFDLSTGITQINNNWLVATMLDLGDDWWLCSCTLTPFDNFNGYVISLSEDAAGTQNYLGDGVSSLYLNAAQMVEGFLVEPSIETEASPADAIGASAQLNHQLFGQGFVDPTILSVNGQVNHQLDIVGIPSEEASDSQRFSYPYDATPTPWSFDNDRGTFDGTEYWVTINFLGIESEEAFGTFEVKFGFSPVAIVSEEAFGSLQLNQRIAGSGAVASLEAFGNFQLDQRLFGQGFVDPTILSVNGQVHHSLDFVGIVSEEAFGTTRFGYTYDSPPSPWSFDNDEGTFDGPETWGLIRINDGIPSEEAFGVVEVIYRVSVSGLVSEEAFGSQRFGYTYDGSPAPWSFDNEIITFDEGEAWQAINFLGLESLEVFGIPNTLKAVRPISIVSAEVVPLPRIVPGFAPIGIESQEAFGTGFVTIQVNLVSISSAEVFGRFGIEAFLLWEPSDAFQSAWLGDTPLTRIWTPDFSRSDSWAGATLLNSTWLPLNGVTQAWSPASKVSAVWTAPVISISSWGAASKTTTPWSSDSAVDTDWDEAA